MKIILYKLREMKGEASLNIIVILLFMTFMIAFTSQVFKAYLVIQNVQAMTQQAVTSVAASNAYGIYNGVRESNSAGIDFNGASWNSVGVNTAVNSQLKSLLKLTQNNNNLEQVQNEIVAYQISNLNTSYTNSSIRADNSLCLNFTTTATLHLPLRLGKAEPITTINIPLKIKSRYLSLY